MNHAQETFDTGRYISEALRTLSPLDLDTSWLRMQVSESGDEPVRNREEREFKLDCEGESAYCQKVQCSTTKTLVRCMKY